MKISYYGYFTPFGGYGIANIHWVKHLGRIGVDVSVNAKFAPYPGTDEWKVLDDEERLMFKMPFEKRKIGVIETTPFNFHMIDTKIKVANTMAESDEISGSWVTELNNMTHVIVPNKFYQKVFKKSGVTVPITVIPHGVSRQYAYCDRPKRKTFTFGSCGYLNKRKGVFEMIRAFSSEFNKNEPVRLKLHTTDPNLGFYKNLKDKRIEITDELWNFDQLNNFYDSLDCFVFPSRAEGIGYPPREAMATGLPTIIMNYSGLEEIAKEEWAYPIYPAGFEKCNPVAEQSGNWAKIGIGELMYQMRNVYKNQEEAREKGMKASFMIKTAFDWEDCAWKLRKFLEQYEV